LLACHCQFNIYIYLQICLHIQDPFGERKGVFDYESILSRLEALRIKLVDKMDHKMEADDDDSADSEPMSEES